MRKNRNSFFAESNMNYSMPNPGGMIPQNIPYQAGANYSSFYSGPGMNNNPMYAEPSNIENRLAKMERQINRLEHRISKLENLNTTYIDNDIDSSGNMYML